MHGGTQGAVWATSLEEVGEFVGFVRFGEVVEFGEGGEVVGFGEVVRFGEGGEVVGFGEGGEVREAEE